MAVIHGIYPPVVDALVRSGRFSTVIAGHSHTPLVEREGDVLMVNPVSALQLRDRLCLLKGSYTGSDASWAGKIFRCPRELGYSNYFGQ